jgi:hypothetical protein
VLYPQTCFKEVKEMVLFHGRLKPEAAAIAFKL